MKTTINYFGRMLRALLLCAGLVITGCYDDSALQGQIGSLSGQLQDHESRLKELERLTAQQNTNIGSLQTIVTALQDKDYVTSVAPINEGDEVVGYTITFSKSGAVTIYNGKDGYVPAMGVKQDESDGQWYWTVDGEWLLDSKGGKVRASAEDGEDGAPGQSGVTPQLKIVDGYWYVSYDGGKTWEEETLGQATGDKGYTMFAEVTYDEEYLYITMADGEKLTLPRTSTGQEVEGPLTWSLDKVTEISATFSGHLEVPASDLPFSQVIVYYSDAENFNINTAKSAFATSFDREQNFTITLTGLKYGTKYNYCVLAEIKTEKIYGEIQTFKTEDVQVNMSVGEITQTAATISGNISLTEKNVLEVGLLYSSSSSDPKTTTSGVNKVVLTDIIDADGNFTYKAENLLNETTHYYRYYIKQGSAYTYGDVSTFKTEKVPVTIEVESIDRNIVTFKGNVQFSEAGVIEIGVQYYPKSTTSQSAGVKKKTITEIAENGDFSVKVSDLLSDTEYKWQYYLLQNGSVITGLPQTYRTADFYNVQSDLNVSSATDLSSVASANCYIISEAGLYKFKTVKGNSTTSVGSVASASILWETFGTDTAPELLDLISGFCYKDSYIAFQTADTFREGNAVIAAKDADGNILWSWHIWLTDKPQSHVYNNDAGTMMDRNLGATSATPGDVGALGLLYQWGRKDPFLGSSSIRSSTIAESTITWPSAVSSNSSNGTIEYATAHPTTFITYNSSNYDWYYTGDSSTDNTRWTTSDKAKSIYDPCPAGWRVPDGGSNGIWSKALGSSSYFEDASLYDSTNKGMNFSGKFGSASTIWYPASGIRSSYGGGLHDVGYGGNYWSASPYGYSAFGLSFNYYGDVSPSNSSGRAYGYSVRCLQE